MQEPLLKQPIFLSKGYYFFYFASASSMMPFLVLYYEQLGLSGRQIGLLAGIPPLMTLFSASIWGGVADATHQHKRLLALAICGAAVMGLAISLASTFLALIPVVMAFAFFTGPIIPLVDNTVLDVLGDRSDRYGKVRLWGALGWGLSAPLMGQLVEQFGLGWTFYGYAVLMLAGLLLAVRLPIVQSSIGSQIGRGLSTLLRDSRWILFLLLIFAGGIGMSMVHSFFFLYLKDLGATSLMMGLSLTIATVSELVVFFFSDRLLKHFGTRKLLTFAVLVSAIRVLGYSLVSDPYLAMGIQLLHGPAFAAMWVAGVAYAKKIAPPGMGATAQGLLTGINFGLASAAGSLLSGFLYEQGGAVHMYRWGAIIIFTGLIVFVIAGRRMNEAASVQPVELS